MKTDYVSEILQAGDDLADAVKSVAAGLSKGYTKNKLLSAVQAFERKQVSCTKRLIEWAEGQK